MTTRGSTPFFFRNRLIDFVHELLECASKNVWSNSPVIVFNDAPVLAALLSNC